MELLMYIMGYFVRHKKVFALIFFANLLTFILSLVLPYMNGYFFDMLIQSPSKQHITKFGIIIALLGGSSTILTYLFNVYKAKIQNQLKFKMFNDVVEKIQKAFYIESSKFNPTYLHQRLEADVNTLWGFFFDKIVNFIFQFIVIIIMIIIIFRINTVLFVLTISVIPVYIIGYLALKKPLYEKGLQCKNVYANFYKTMNEQLQFIREIKIQGNYDYNNKKRNYKFQQYQKSYMGYNRLLYIYNMLEGNISLLFKVVGLVIAGFEIMKGNLTLGDFTIVGTYFSMLIQGFKFFFSYGQSYQDANNSYARIKELLALKEEVYGIEKIEEEVKSIVVKNLSFSYHNRKIIDKSNMEIYQGINVIQGENGRGKSTLMYLLCGILTGEDSSEILINDYEVKKIDIQNLRKSKISFYVQNQKGMDETVAEMLEMHLGGDVWNLEQRIHEKHLEELYFTDSFKISDYLNLRICSLSGGEAQKIMLLPVLLKTCDILILDEPTSDLDIKSKKVLIRILEERTNAIIIVVTHEKYLFHENTQVRYLTLSR